MHEPLGAQFPGKDPVVTVPVVLPPTEPRIITGIAGGKFIAGIVLKLSGAVALKLIGAVIELGVGLAPTGLIVLVPTGVVVEVEPGAPELAEVTLITDGEISCVAGEQFRLVPGRVGSSANGGVAKVVTGAPGTVAAEKRLVNGLGPVKGDDTIAPGVVGRPIAVVPIVDICAKQLPQFSKSIVVIKSKVRI